MCSITYPTNAMAAATPLWKKAVSAEAIIYVRGRRVATFRNPVIWLWSTLSKNFSRLSIVTLENSQLQQTPCKNSNLFDFYGILKMFEGGRREGYHSVPTVRNAQDLMSTTTARLGQLVKERARCYYISRKTPWLIAMTWYVLSHTHSHLPKILKQTVGIKTAKIEEN